MEGNCLQDYNDLRIEGLPITQKLSIDFNNADKVFITGSKDGSNFV